MFLTLILFINFSFLSLNEIISSMLAIFNLCFFANIFKSFNLAILPSWFITSQITALGFNLDNLDISTEASV